MVLENDYKKQNHYKLKGVDAECVDVIRSVCNDDENGFLNYCIGNVIKYAVRCKRKGQLLSDLKKIKVYCDYAIDQLERV